MLLLMSFSSNLRSQVLTLYRQALKLSKTWQAVDPSKTSEERNYIMQEAKTLFRQNKNVKSPEEFQQHLQEAEARIGIAQHYQTPYPRPTNLPQTTFLSVAQKKKSRVQEEIQKLYKPVYLKSYGDTNSDKIKK